MKTRMLALTLFVSLALFPSTVRAQVSVDVGVGYLFDGLHLGFSYHSWDGYESGFADVGYSSHSYADYGYAHGGYDLGWRFDPFCWDGYFRYHPRRGYGCYERDAFDFGISIAFGTYGYHPYGRFHRRPRWVHRPPWIHRPHYGFTGYRYAVTIPRHRPYWNVWTFDRVLHPTYVYGPTYVYAPTYIYPDRGYSRTRLASAVYPQTPLRYAMPRLGTVRRGGTEYKEAARAPVARTAATTFGGRSVSSRKGLQTRDGGRASAGSPGPAARRSGVSRAPVRRNGADAGRRPSDRVASPAPVRSSRDVPSGPESVNRSRPSTAASQGRSRASTAAPPVRSRPSDVLGPSRAPVGRAETPSRSSVGRSQEGSRFPARPSREVRPRGGSPSRSASPSRTASPSRGSVSRPEAQRSRAPSPSTRGRSGPDVRTPRRPSGSVSRGGSPRVSRTPAPSTGRSRPSPSAGRSRPSPSAGRARSSTSSARPQRAPSRRPSAPQVRSGGAPRGSVGRTSPDRGTRRRPR